jgi:hypothetical protein
VHQFSSCELIPVAAYQAKRLLVHNLGSLKAGLSRDGKAPLLLRAVKAVLRVGSDTTDESF